MVELLHFLTFLSQINTTIDDFKLMQINNTNSMNFKNRVLTSFYKGMNYEIWDMLVSIVDSEDR